MAEEREWGATERTPLGERIVELRDAAGWGQRRLAKEAKISPVTVTHIETGKIPEPRLSTLRKIANAFGMTTEELIAPKAAARPRSRDWLNDRAGHALLSRSNEEAMRIIAPLRTNEEISTLREEVRDEAAILDDELNDEQKSEELDPELRESLEKARSTAIYWLMDLSKQRTRIQDEEAVRGEHRFVSLMELVL